jgi:hypothetical protein
VGTSIFNPPGAYNFEMSELGESSKGGNVTEIGQFTVSGTSLKGLVITNNNSTSAQKLTATAVTATLPKANGRIEITPANLPARRMG